MFFENTPCERPHLEPSGVTLLARFYEGDAPHRLRWEARRYSPMGCTIREVLREPFLEKVLDFGRQSQPGDTARSARRHLRRGCPSAGEVSGV